MEPMCDYCLRNKHKEYMNKQVSDSGSIINF